jgi:hypothetical protein
MESETACASRTATSLQAEELQVQIHGVENQHVLELLRSQEP